MKAKLSLLIVVLIALLVLLASGCRQGSPTTTVTGTQTTITVPATGGTSTIDLELKDFKFMPDTIETKAGNIVILNLVNRDSADHTFTLDAFSTDVRLPAGMQESIQFLADKKGTFEFHCSIHPSMRGSLVVK